MSGKYSAPITSPLYPPPPYHYEGSQLFLGLFYCSEDSLAKLLPEPLRPSDLQLAGVMIGEHPCKETGTFREAAVIVQCLFDNERTGEEEVGVYFAHDWCDTDVALAAGREIWGYPRKLGTIDMNWVGNELVCRVLRNDTELLHTTCDFTDEGEWIDSGPNLNVRRILSAVDDGYVLSEITAAYLEYGIKNGRSGEVEIEFKGDTKEALGHIEIESTMIGLFFETDIYLPPPQKVATYH